MQIKTFEPKYKADFISMNKAWINEMFELEAADLAELENIEQAVAQGGQVFFAVNEQDIVMACCMLAPLPNGEWEIQKFAAKAEFKGSGAGKACLQAALDYALEQGIRKLVIVSNRKCEAAVHLYRKFGFQEVPVDKAKFPFDRADIAFEKVLK